MQRELQRNKLASPENTSISETNNEAIYLKIDESVGEGD